MLYGVSLHASGRSDCCLEMISFHIIVLFEFILDEDFPFNWVAQNTYGVFLVMELNISINDLTNVAL